MRAVAWFLSLLWGVGQNLPFDRFYVHGISPGDFAFVVLLGAMLSDRNTRAQFLAEALRLRGLFALVFAFVTLTAMSSAANAFSWDMDGSDLVEIVRPFYYFAIVIFISLATRRYGLGVLAAFVVGIVVSGVVAYLRPTSDDVLGFVMLWNPNVIGNMLAIGVLFSSLLICEGRLLSAAAFLLSCMVLSIFTYSKGTWLMALVAFGACLLAMRAAPGRRNRWAGRIALGGGLGALAVLAVINFSAIYDLIAFKLSTTQFGDTAAEGGTAAARWGFVATSFNLAAEHPLFGIGISNFENVYRTLERPLGNAYWATDNPHSAWLYMLACMGIPALLVFGAIFVHTLRTLGRKVPLNGTARVLYVGAFAGVLFFSGAVMLQLLTQYFFWFLAGVVHGWREDGVR